MKRFYYILLILGLSVLSCHKPTDTPVEQEVVFTATTNTTGLKSSTCDNPRANFALIEIDGVTRQIDVFYLNDKIYTNSFKLTPGNHTVDMFVLVNDGGSPDNPDGDQIVQAAPLSGNTYANFVSHPLSYNFEVDAFVKAEISIEVLCYEPADYENFGFAWFSVDQIIVREFCFFGDFCVDDYSNYEGSLYEYQRNGLQHDMPAIFKIDVIRNGDTLISYDNADWYGEGRPLCVKYPDYSSYTDEFQFVLSVLVKEGDSFVYTHVYTFTTTDDENLPNIGDDGILDFVLGECMPDADLVLPPYEDPTPPSESTCETAFAYGGTESAICFLEEGFGNWGWTNGRYNFGEFNLDLIAAAGGCDQSKGTNVGQVTLKYSYNTVQVTYNVTEGFELSAVQLYIGYDKFPEKGDDPTVAPGQYTVIDDTLEAGTSSYTFNLSGYTNKIYIIAHADVCGNYPNL
ncbi:MAG: hypothetical protein JW729_05280 [Bacteroidales bacterium]|nr:hypothetical protein [Bacteroidales bacterium]